ncbi:MAG: metalloregulator ArsR/SmtB family transcription factor [Desulfitobacteriaceae bacterium]|nr:metalloregulator ArsR/SmtB family transcription factor [Desulfitobacteriaceae bacterium]MDD4752430.1 metalloregulator ArsR/SmtB family transcription factor [Desulfitobacteriaceae bacterium]
MTERDVCEIFCSDMEKVNRVKNRIKSTIGLADIFKALADDTRVKIAYALATEGELCVCDVANIIDSSVANASHHLRILRQMGLAKYEKRGKMVYYSLDDEHVLSLINQAFEHLQEGKHHGR